MELKSCFKCKDTYQNQIQLSCKHLLCQKCIMRQILKKNLLELPEKETIMFQCKCKIGFVSLSLYKIEEIIKKNTDKSPPSCKNHNGESIKFCKDCKSYLCQKCLEAHKELFKQHNIIHITETKKLPLNTLSSICQIHGKDFTHYCKNDKISFCNSCLNNEEIISPHKAHEIVTYKSLINIVDDKVNKLQFKTYENFIDYFDKIEYNFDNKYNDNYNKTIKILESMIETINKTLEGYQKKMEIKFAKKNLIMGIIKRVYQNYYDDIKILKGGNKNINLIKFLSKDYNEFADIKFKSDLDSIISKLEKVKNNIEKEDISQIIKISYSYFSKKEIKLHNSLKEQFKSQITDIIEIKDGKIVVSSEDSEIKIFDKSGNVFYILKGHSHSVRALCYIRDDIFASGSNDKTIRIWDLQQNKSIEILKEPNNQIISLNLLNNQKLASCSFKEIYIYDDKFKLQYLLKEHLNWVRNIIQIDKNKICSCSDDGTIKIYDKHFQILNTLNEHNNSVFSICLLRDGRFISGDKKGKLFCWFKNFSTNKEYKFHNSGILKIIQIKDGRIVSSSLDKTIKVWDLDFRNVNTFKNHNNVQALCPLKDGGFCSGGNDIVLNFWK